MASRADGRQRAGGDRGTVTAETAVVLPGLVVLLTAALWLVAAFGAHIRCLDAAREAARALARGEPAAVVNAVVAATAPGASFVVRRGPGSVTVTVTEVVGGPGPMFSRLPGAQVAVSTTALTESAEWGGGPGS